MIRNPMILIPALLLISAGVFAQQTIDNPPEFQNAGITEHLGDTIPSEAVFTNDLGEQVTIGDYLHQDRPLIIMMVYYNCPMLCSMVMNGMTESARELEYTPGKDYTALSVSINPRETWKLAAAKKANYIKEFGRPEAGEGWHFMVGEEDQSRKLANALGFNYYYDEKQEQYAHSAAIFVVTSEGVISRYLYGISFEPRDLKLALVEASNGKIGNTLDRVLLYCYHYDPDARGYAVQAGNVMKLGGFVTLIVLGTFLAILWWRERRKRGKRSEEAQHHNTVSVG